MGWMKYDGLTVEFDDRVLAHLQVVIMLRFRAGEPFPLSWMDSQAVGHGRSSMWMSPTFPVYFKFRGSRPPAIDPQWLERYRKAAESSVGLIVVDEDGSLIQGSPTFDGGPGPGSTTYYA
jgi:hypothetical protein